MDSRRFDTLTRSLSSAGLRRHVLLAALGGALSLLGLSRAPVAVAGGACQPSCGACQRCQPGHCHKAKHGKKRCQRGTCVATLPGTVSCDGSCVDLTSDPHHCGSCGMRCSVNQTCTAGSCRCTIFDVAGGRVCPIPTPNATCCAAGVGCACSPADPNNILDPTTCTFISDLSTGTAMYRAAVRRVATGTRSCEPSTGPLSAERSVRNTCALGAQRRSPHGSISFRCPLPRAELRPLPAAGPGPPCSMAC